MKNSTKGSENESKEERIYTLIPEICCTLSCVSCNSNMRVEEILRRCENGSPPRGFDSLEE